MLFSLPFLMMVIDLSANKPNQKEDAAESVCIEAETDYDIGLTLYRDSATKNRVIDFYTDFTGSPEISLLILKYADIYDIPLSLAFSLAWAESRYNPEAVNRNSSSVDRGLYQLNSKSFPDLTEKDFFSPDVNSKTGLKYFRYCLDAGENEIVALAMYNAGRTRVLKGGTPLVTLDHISSILDYKEMLEKKLEKHLTRVAQAHNSGKEIKNVKYILDRKKQIK